MRMFENEIAVLIEKYGKSYKPALLPDDIHRGPIGKCFDWSALQTAKNYPHYQYVEGAALDPDAYRAGKEVWIYHGWLSDGVHAFDPTWVCTNDKTGQELPVPTLYVGIALPFLLVRDFMKATGYQGVLGNQWRAPELFKKIIEEATNADTELHNIGGKQQDDSRDSRHTRPSRSQRNTHRVR